MSVFVSDKNVFENFLNNFFMFLNRFDMLILKINFKKQKYYFNIFSNKTYYKK